MNFGYFIDERIVLFHFIDKILSACDNTTPKKEKKNAKNKKNTRRKGKNTPDVYKQVSD